MSADLALAADPSFIERSADPGEFVLQACERAKVWLREALDHGQIDEIVELKSQAEAVRVYTMQKQLGKDAELSAAEVVRRAERGIGVAIRRGQGAGEIRQRGDDTRTDLPDRGADKHLVSPRQFFNGNSNEMTDAYVMRDIDDEDFAEVLEEAKAERNLSRANVVRKIRAQKSPSAEPAPQPAASPRKRREPLAGTLLNCVLQMQGTIDRLELELQDGLDESVTPEMAGGWADDLTGVIRPLNRLRSLLKEKANG